MATRSSPAGAALDCKEQGNRYYLAFRFTAAEESYTQGLIHAPAATFNDDSSLRAVLFSNRGNARFEQGNYGGAAQDSKEALWLLLAPQPGSSGDNNKQLLVTKNQWRLARSLYYAGNPLDNIPELVVIADEATRTKIQKLKQQQETFTTKLVVEQSHSTATHFTPQWMRSGLNNPICEYYPFGHDDSETALKNSSQPLDNDEDYLDFTQLQGQDFCVFYGGIGDARHLYATILHANHIREHSTTPTPKLRFTINDLNAQVLLKDLFVLLVTLDIGKHAPPSGNNGNLENLVKYPRALELLLVLYYTTLCHAMPPEVHKTFVALMKQLFLDSMTLEQFLLEHPWLHLSEQDWTRLIRNASCWVDPDHLYEPPLPSVQEALAGNSPRPPPSAESLKAYAQAHLGLSDTSNYANQIQAKADEQKQEFLKYKESQRNIQNWPEGTEEMLRIKYGHDRSDEELVEIMMEMLDEMEDDVDNGESMVTGARDKICLVVDKAFFEATHAILPFSTNYPGLLPNETSFLPRNVRHCERCPESAKELMRKQRTRIHKTWICNPVKYDPDYWMGQDVNGPDVTHPVIDWADGYFGGEMCQFLHIPPDHEVEKHLITYLFDIFARYYVNLGWALKDLIELKKLHIEVSLESMLTFCEALPERAEERQTNGLNTCFTRMFLSNVPDYTGMLATLTLLTPVLSKTSAVKSTLRSNVLLNTGLFKDYNEYVFGTIGLSYQQACRLLQWQLMEDTPDMWNNFNQWGVSDHKADDVGMEEVKQFLHQLFLNTVVPPKRDTISCREELPNTMDLFLQVCRRCLELYPVHWILSTLDELCSVQMKTKAFVVIKSPSLPLARTKKQTVTLKVFQLELRNRITIWVHSKRLPPLFSTPLPTGRPLKLNFSLKCDQYETSGYRQTSCLGMLLEKKPNADFAADDSGNPFMGMMGFMGSHGGGAKKSRLRQAVLDGTAGHLFSCISYNSVEGTIETWLCEDVYQEYGDYFVSIIRTDSWSRVDHETVRLRDARTSS